MHRLLSSHRLMQPHRSTSTRSSSGCGALILAEFPGRSSKRDYDTSLPDVTGDREQLIQAILNIVRNAAQALEGAARSCCAPARCAR
jgi:two-component system nitrogen regulation sensor histidine kinase GlnL